jgi:OmpA-OmpF porin, OOP family
MKNVFAVIIFCFLLTNLYAQDQSIRPKSLAVSFVMVDVNTAQRLHNTSLSQVFRDKKWAKFNEMSPGLGLTYFKGLTKHIDFAGSLVASYVNLPLRNKPASSSDGFLLEADASGNFKLLPETYVLTPYVSAGVGASKYKNYYGAFLPLGAGLKVNLFNEASIFLAGQYRIPVSYETNNYHFMYSFGIAGVIGK